MLHWLIIALQIAECDEWEKVGIRLLLKSQILIDLVIQIPCIYDYSNQTILLNVYIYYFKISIRQVEIIIIIKSLLEIDRIMFF